MNRAWSGGGRLTVILRCGLLVLLVVVLVDDRSAASNVPPVALACHGWEWVVVFVGRLGVIDGFLGLAKRREKVRWVW